MVVRSGGNKRKVSAALAFMGNPSLVFLDEPTTVECGEGETDDTHAFVECRVSMLLPSANYGK